MMGNASGQLSVFLMSLSISHVFNLTHNGCMLECGSVRARVPTSVRLCDVRVRIEFCYTYIYMVMIQCVVTLQTKTNTYAHVDVLIRSRLRLSTPSRPRMKWIHNKLTNLTRTTKPSKLIHYDGTCVCIFTCALVDEHFKTERAHEAT